jgi:hypothetical protein
LVEQIKKCKMVWKSRGVNPGGWGLRSPFRIWPPAPPRIWKIMVMLCFSHANFAKNGLGPKIAKHIDAPGPLWKRKDCGNSGIARIFQRGGFKCDEQKFLKLTWPFSIFISQGDLPPTTLWLGHCVGKYGED